MHNIYNLVAYFIINILLLNIHPCLAANTEELKILRITPEGEDVAAGKQIVFQFNLPMVAIGDMKRESQEIPVAITPALHCNWRWQNSSALACNLEEENKLLPATKYEIVVSPGFTAINGLSLKQKITHSFITQRPNVDYAWTSKWLSPSYPVIKIVFTQPVTKKSVESSLVFQQNKDTQDYKIKASPEPEQILAKEVKKYAKNGEEARLVWLINPVEELALDSALTLKLKPGLVSAYGDEKSAETREVHSTHSFPEFKFLGVKCFSKAGNEIFFEPSKISEALCNPMASINLMFNSPILYSQIKNNLIFNPKLIDIDDHRQDYSLLDRSHQKNEIYEVNIPGGVKALTEYLVRNKIPERNFWQKIWSKFESNSTSNIIRDQFDRSLSNDIDLTFKTDHRKANFVLPYNQVVIEKNIDSEIPIYINNLNNLSFNYNKIDANSSQSNLTVSSKVPELEDIQFAIPFNIRGILNGKSGAVYGVVTAQPLVDNMLNHLFAQVTPFQLHFKLGHFNSILWVTDLATGQPVEGAQVTIYKDKVSSLSGAGEVLTSGITSKSGIAVLDGNERLDPKLLLQSWRDDQEVLFVRVDKDGDIALLPANENFYIDKYRIGAEDINYSSKMRYSYLKTWGITAQGVYRLGDKVQYKFYVRAQDNKTFASAPKDGYSLEVVDPLGNTIYEVKNLSLNEFGSYANEFAVSKQGAVGWYVFNLKANFIDPEKKEYQYIGSPIKVLLSDFNTSPFKVSNQLNGKLFYAEENVEVSSQANLHSGGAYSNADLKVTASLESQNFSSKDSTLKNFSFDVYNNQDQKQIFQKIERLDNKGENKINIKLPKQDIYYGKLIFESAVSDDRGKQIVAQTSADYVSVDRLVGLSFDEWLFIAGNEALLRYVVVDALGTPKAGTKIDIIIEREETKAARVKGVGNAYLTEFTESWVKDASCFVDSESQPGTCKFTPKQAGRYRVKAKINDTKGHEHITTSYLYVQGKDYVLWNTKEDYTLEIIPEKKAYQVGEKARYFIKNPYPGAKALVSIERYGVIDHFVQTFSESTSMIEFEVKPDYLPGFYLSVVIFSPRTTLPIKDQVDLGKPTFKIGYVTVEVKDQYKEMLVTAKTNREEYKPRETVKLALEAKPKFDNRNEPIEAAVIVIDESVFDLIAEGISYFDPYQGFYKLDSLDLKNYSLITRLIGRQKFEKKGANPGGDGGSDLAMRNLFQFVSYWNPSIKLDKLGKASVEFIMPDNLTSWKVLVITSTASDKMGLGQAEFKVNLPTEIRPNMPNQVLENDSFEASFSVMNRTDKKRDLEVFLKAEGNLDKKTINSMHKKISLEPYARTLVFMPVKVGYIDNINENGDLAEGNIKFTVSAADSIDGDLTEHNLKVKAARSIENAANYGIITQSSVTDQLKFPAKIYPDSGLVSVVVSPSIIGNIDGAFKYMKNYPYSCWEQKLSKALTALYYLEMQNYLSKDLIWQEARNLPNEILETAANFQAPNGGMVYFTAQDQYVDPYLSAYSALVFNQLKRNGYAIPPIIEHNLHKYLDNLLKQNANDIYTSDENIALSIKAIALAALAENSKISAADLERYASATKKMDVFAKAHFVLAAVNTPGGEKYAIEALKTIIDDSNISANDVTFNEKLNENYRRILSSKLRTNCAVLSALTKLQGDKNIEELTAHLAVKLANTITRSRDKNNSWYNTQENLFCLKGLIDYAEVFENQAPEMIASIKLNDNKLGEVKFTKHQDKPVIFTKKIKPNDLGTTMKSTVSTDGRGTLYYTNQISFAASEENMQNINAGIEIKREYRVQQNGKWELLQSPYLLKTSDIVKIDLFVSLPASRNFVVVEDPVPGGLEPVNRNLANTSDIGADASSDWNFYHQELRHDAVRFYADYLPAGNYHLSYAAQAITAGDFAVLPACALEMYQPDNFGKSSFARLKVERTSQ